MEKGFYRSHPMYNSWRGMKKRCYQKSHDSYPNYGGRGIKVCDHWREDVSLFFQDMLPTWEEGKSLDRIDTNGDYTPENCRWATPKEQQRNKRNNVNVEFNGIIKTASEWDEIKGYKTGTVANRVNRFGMRAENAINKETEQSYEAFGETKTLREWANEYGVSKQILYQRINKGMALKDALTTGVRKTKRKFEYRGESLELREWCEKLGLNYRTVNSRLTTLKWPVDKAFETD